MDLSKTHDCVNHELSIAKLAACGLNEGSLRLIQNYLSKRKQRFFPEQMARSYSRCPSRVNKTAYFIYFHKCLLLIKETGICNFADDTTLYKNEINLDIVLENLEMDANIAINR